MDKKNVKSIPLFIVVIIIVVIIFCFRQISRKESNKEINEITDAENTYSRTIINKSYNSDTNLKIIEVSTIDTKLDSIIITSEMIEKMKNNEGIYNNTLKEVLENDETSSKDLYNITKAIELGYVTESNTYIEYYSMITDFETSAEFIEFCEETFYYIEK